MTYAPRAMLTSLHRAPSAMAFCGPGGEILFRTDDWSRRVQPDSEQIAWDPSQNTAQLTAKASDGQTVVCPVVAIRTESGFWLQMPEATREGETTIAQLRDRVSELEAQAHVDKLTGLWNRRYFEFTIAAEVARSGRYQQPLTLLVIDVDRFKSINDTHGHAVGDAALVRVAGLLRQRSRQSDLVMRWGGDEFAVLATCCTWQSAVTLAQSLRSCVADAEVAPGVRTTLSIGVGQYLPGESPQTWFERVDRQLYAAKQGGRNTVCADSACPPQNGGAVVQLLWQDAYLSGQPVIDEQHIRLLQLANRVLRAALPTSDRGSDQAALLAELDTLLAHVVRHFADEEAIIRAAGYPRAEQHALAHQKLVATATNLRGELVAGRARLGDLVDFLAREVVVRHMATADVDFFPWLQGP